MIGEVAPLLHPLRAELHPRMHPVHPRCAPGDLRKYFMGCKGAAHVQTLAIGDFGQLTSIRGREKKANSLHPCTPAAAQGRVIAGHVQGAGGVQRGATAPCGVQL